MGETSNGLFCMWVAAVLHLQGYTNKEPVTIGNNRCHGKFSDCVETQLILLVKVLFYLLCCHLRNVILKGKQEIIIFPSTKVSVKVMLESNY